MHPLRQNPGACRFIHYGSSKHSKHSPWRDQGNPWDMHCQPATTTPQKYTQLEAVKCSTSTPIALCNPPSPRSWGVRRGGGCKHTAGHHSAQCEPCAPEQCVRVCPTRLTTRADDRRSHSLGSPLISMHWTQPVWPGAAGVLSSTTPVPVLPTTLIRRKPLSVMTASAYKDTQGRHTHMWVLNGTERCACCALPLQSDLPSVAQHSKA
jgi:hypothetical protein